MTDFKPECPSCFTVDFARRLIAYLGGDPAPIKNHWGWRELARHYPELRKKLERYFEQVRTGDPAMFAFYMGLYFHSDRRWVEKVIENAKTGNPALYARRLVYPGSITSREWAKKVIEQAQSGDPAWAAYHYVHYSHFRSLKEFIAERKWAEKVIAKATIGNPKIAASYMVRYCGSHPAWARRVAARQAERGKEESR